MSINIEDLYKDINGSAPDRKSVEKIKQAALQLKLEDHDAFWLVLIVFEGQQAEVAKAMTATTSLADVASKAAVETTEGAAAKPIPRQRKAGSVFSMRLKPEVIQQRR